MSCAEHTPRLEKYLPYGPAGGPLSGFPGLVVVGRYAGDSAGSVGGKDGLGKVLHGRGRCLTQGQGLNQPRQALKISLGEGFGAWVRGRVLQWPIGPLRAFKRVYPGNAP